MNIKISVVIPTYQRTKLLRRCLSALRDQTLEAGLYEVIVVNDQYRKGPAWARNQGWKQARGKIVAFTDDDCIPDKNWLKTAYLKFQKGAWVICGKVIVPTSKIPTDYELNVKHMEKAEFLTANLFCKKEILQKLGGFDERFTLAFREDSDFQFSLMEKNIPIIYSPHTKVIHPVRRVPLFTSLAEQKKSLFNALLFKKHPLLFRERIQKLPPFFYYLSTIFLLMAFVRSHSLTGWTIFTGIFILKRLRNTSHSFNHIIEMIVTSILIPPLSIFWRVYGAVKYRVFFI